MKLEMNTWMLYIHTKLNGSNVEHGLRVYDGPDKMGKYRYEIRYFKEGQTKGQFFHAKLPEGFTKD